MRALAEDESDERIAELLNAEGATTRNGLPWTALRVQQRRAYQQIPSGQSFGARRAVAHQQGLLSAAEAATKLGVTRTALRAWGAWGFLHVEQQADGDPRWVRLTDDDLARLDGRLARQGYGCWTMQEAQRALGVSKEELWELTRTGRLVAYHVQVRDQWRWRLSPAGEGPIAPSATGAFGSDLSGVDCV